MGEGDSTVSVFQDPAAAVRAMTAAVAAIDAEPWPASLAIRIRAGVHTGEIELRDGVYFGTTINMAARVRGHADGGQVLSSAVTSPISCAPSARRCASSSISAPTRCAACAAASRSFAVSAPGVEAPPPAECPYRGLLAVRARRREFFFGREDVVPTCWRPAPRRAAARRRRRARAAGSRPSLRAGLVARARRRGGGRDAGATITPGVDRSRRSTSASRSLVVDQFEELFTLCADDAVRERVRRRAARARPGKVAIGLRADFYGECAAFPALAAAIAANQVLLGPMADRRAPPSDRGTGRPVGLRFEPGLDRRPRARRQRASPARCHCSRTRCSRRGSAATAARSRSRATARRAA